MHINISTSALAVCRLSNKRRQCGCLTRPLALVLSAAMSTTWTRYYDAAGEQPRETLLFALDRFDAEAGAEVGGLFAVDLGCGTGRDSIELLRRGWRVLAID